MTVLTIPEPTRHMTSLTWHYKPTIFDTSMLTIQQQRQFTELFSQTMVDTQIQLGEKAPQIFVWFEEAHTPMPLWIFNSKQLPQTGRLITQGANFNISFGLITQFCAMVAKLPVKASSQRYFGCTSEPNDVKYLRQYIGKEWANQLCDLATGEFIYNYGKTIKRFQVPYKNQKQNSWLTYDISMGNSKVCELSRTILS